MPWRVPAGLRAALAVHGCTVLGCAQLVAPLHEALVLSAQPCNLGSRSLQLLVQGLGAGRPGGGCLLLVCCAMGGGSVCWGGRLGWHSACCLYTPCLLSRRRCTVAQSRE